jgi:outer membrane protein
MRSFVSLLLLIAACTPVLAEDRTPAGIQNLADIFQLAKQNDAAWASAQAGNTAAQENLVQGKALLLPNVGLSASATQTFSDAEFPGRRAFVSGVGIVTGQENFENFHTYDYRLSLSQPVYDKQKWVAYKESTIQVSQADVQLSAALQDLILRVAQVYFDMLLAQDTVELNVAQKSAIANQLEQARVSFEVGTATITDVHDAQARYDLIVAQEIASRNALEVKQQAAQQIIGQLPQRIAVLQDKPLLKPVDPNGMDQWVGIAEQQNIKLKFQKMAMDIANQEVEKAKAGHYPTLNLVANHDVTNPDGSIFGKASRNDLTTSEIGLQFQVPLYQGGATSSRVRQAIANQQKAQDDLETARRQADFDVRQAYLEATSNLSQVQAYEQALISSQSSLDSTRLGYEVGVRTSVDVLNAQQQYFSAKRDLLRVRYNYLLSKLKLKGASGLLAEADLNETNQLLVNP